jgi:transposase
MKWIRREHVKVDRVACPWLIKQANALAAASSRSRAIRSNTKDMPAFFPKTLYKARARIEQAVGKLKRFKRIALRCEKTAQNYGSFVALALGFILVKSVHTA